MEITPIIVTALWATAPGFAASCEGLASLALPQAKISIAQVVAAGTFAPPAGRPDPLNCRRRKGKCDTAVQMGELLSERCSEALSVLFSELFSVGVFDSVNLSADFSDAPSPELSFESEVPFFPP